MSSTVTVTVRCADCSRVLAAYYAVPRDPQARARLTAISHDLLDWHRKDAGRCPATKTRLSDRADPR